MSRRAMTVPAGTPTQVAHPWRSVLRVILAWVVGLAVAALARAGIDLTELAPAMVESLAIGVWAFVTGLIQWVLTRPSVEHLLKGTPFSTGVETEGRHVA